MHKVHDKIFKANSGIQKVNDNMQNIIYCCLTVLICILILYWVKTATDSILKILLYPHAKLTEIYYNIRLSYINGTGYVSSGGNIVIGRECMGYKFVVMVFSMTSCMFVKYFERFKKVMWFLLSLSGSVAVGVLISCVRIIGSFPFASLEKFPLIHSAIGVFLYFNTLIIIYNVLNRKFNHKLNYKLIRSEKNE